MIERLSGTVLLFGLAAFVPAAKADVSLQFTLDQNQCCAYVTLTPVSSTEVGVAVTLKSGDVFVATGNGSNHPGFAFNITGDPLINITNITTNNSNLFTVGSTNDATNGPAFGTFDYTLNAPGNGANAGVNELNFDVTLKGGGSLSPTDFIANSDKYFFVADIFANGSTAESGSLGPGTPVGTVPEPTSVVLLTTLVAGCLVTLRKRRSA